MFFPPIKSKIVFGWWNTGLSPSGKSSLGKTDFKTAACVVRKLVEEEEVDFLGLGEITKLDLERLRKSLAMPHFEVYDGTRKTGRLQFDTGGLYNTRKLRVSGESSIIESHGTRKFKLANQINFQILEDKLPLHVFLSHWPSHLVPNSESSRITLGSRLNSIVRQVRNSYDPLVRKARVVLMGDYNEEPFHASLETQMLATRDRQMASKNDSYLYNPFWRHLGESAPYHPGTLSFGPTRVAGTCFIANGHYTKWKTVDQIMFSSAFLGNSDWHLNERFTKVLPITGTKKANFDHVPVVAMIENNVC